MKITIESTEQIVTLNGVPARVWEGTSAGGVRVHAFITRIAVDREDDGTEFDDLSEHAEPTVAWPPMMFIGEP